MKPKTNGDVLSLMESFLKPVRMEKQACGGAAMHSTSGGKEKKADGAKAETYESNPGFEPRGAMAESVKDKNKAIGMTVPADSREAVNEAGANARRFPTQIKTTQSDEAGNLEHSSTDHTDPEADGEKNSKKVKPIDKAAFVRNTILANNVLALMQAEAGQMEKAAQERAIEKTAEEQIAEQAAEEYRIGYIRGLQKRAEDKAELLKAGFSEELADYTLDKIAAENPSAVMPEEAIPPEVAEAALAGGAPEGGAPEAVMGGEGAEDGDFSPEEHQQLSQLADALDSAGVSPDDLAEAAKTVQELQAQGVSPEEIVQAVHQMAQEGGADEPAEQEKTAAEMQQYRVDAVKNFLAQKIQGR